MLFGDGDGFESFRVLWESGAPTLWLDSHLASARGTVLREDVPGGVQELGPAPVSYWGGVNSCETAAAAVRGELRYKGW